MLDPGYLDGLPARMVELYAQAEADILADMARRISIYDYWVPAAEWQRRKLLEMGKTHEDVMQRLSMLTGRSRDELNRLFLEAGSAAVDADNAVYAAQGLKTTAIQANKALQKVLEAGLRRTNGLFENLTRTTANTAAKQFENALDRAYMQVTSGAFDANSAIRTAVKDLARQGVGAVEYPSGRVESIEAAVRRSVVTGVNQTALELQTGLADEMGCDLVEVTAHAGARPEHAQWQGKIYSRSGKHPKYPDFAAATGYGTGAGLGGWNCRHSFYPYFEGSARAYTPGMLREYERKAYTYNGQKLTEYEATQEQRHIERQIRRWKREEAAMRAAGQDAGEAAAKVARWQKTQRDFINQTGLKRQYDREQVANAVKSGIIKPGLQKSEDADVHYIGKLDRRIYRCVTADMVTDEVIITARQVQHIRERHPSDFERFSSYFPEIVADPDYIIEANKPNTALVLKEIRTEKEVFKTVIRLVSPEDDPAFKNSVITFMKIDEKEWNRLLRNKRILYKKE